MRATGVDTGDRGFYSNRMLYASNPGCVCCCCRMRLPSCG